jgi:hypothetical protein
MISENRWYSSKKHFETEWSYEEYLEHEKAKRKRKAKSKQSIWKQAGW